MSQQKLSIASTELMNKGLQDFPVYCGIVQIINIKLSTIKICIYKQSPRIYANLIKHTPASISSLPNNAKFNVLCTEMGMPIEPKS